MAGALSERVAVVTGAGGGREGGIGAAIARVLAASEAVIAVNDVSHESAAATVEDLRAAGGTAEAFVADVSDPGETTRMVAAVAECYGGVDILVNNAGIVGVHTIEETPDDEWRRVLDVNLSGPFYASRAAIPHLKRSRAGRVVFVASIAGIRVGTLGGAVYTASKAGLLGLMRHLAAEVGQHGVTANAVLPGMVMTPLVARGTTGESRQELFEAVPAGRAARPEEIGEAVAFLASDRAAYVNGAELTVDGGRTVLPGAFAPWARAARLPREQSNTRRTDG